MILRRIAHAMQLQDWTTVFVEFVLVVTGVFVALQFDNWNSNRILKIQEHEILEALVEDLEANIVSFTTNIDFDRESIKACDGVMNVLDSGQGWDDDTALLMSHCRAWTSPYLTSFAYQSLMAEGVGLISNRQLRRAISELYESDYRDLVGDTDRSFWEYQHTVMLPTFSEYLFIPPHGEDLGWPNRPMFPLDFETLRKSQKFRTVILGKRSHSSLSVKEQKSTREATTEVLKLIQTELNGE